MSIRGVSQKAHRRTPTAAFRRRAVLLLSILPLAVAVSAAGADKVAPPSKIDVAALTLPPVRAFDVVGGGRTYTIFVMRPPGPPPRQGFPALVVLDANLNFAAAANAAWARATFADIAPTMIVGIGYPSNNLQQFLGRRAFDFTDRNAANSSPDPGVSGRQMGGAEAFRDDVIEPVLKRLEKEKSVNPRCRVIFGQSAGGLFVVSTLLHRPNMFEGYFAASPSLQLETKQTFDIAAWRRAVAELKLPVRVRLEVGELEAALTPRQMKAFPQFKSASTSYMISNTLRLSQMLASLASPKLEVSSEVLKKESHNSEGPRALSEAITFASNCPYAAE